MTRLKLMIAAAALLIGVTVFARPAQAVTTYGTTAAQAALQFDPFNPSAVPVTDDRFLQRNQPTITPRAAWVQAPAVTRTTRTPTPPGKPTLNVVDAPRVFEGPFLHDKPLVASFIVTLKPTTQKTVTVRFRTVNGTARAGIEYASKTGTLTFGPGRFTQIVNVDILNDDLKVNTNVPHPRTFFLEIFNPTNAVIGRSRGIAEITENGKKQVGIVVGNALPVYEVGTGMKSMFTISLNHQSSQVVKVNFKTTNGSAQAGTDYKAVNGTLTFQPGQTMKTVSVQIFDNKGQETIVEAFFLDISNPVNAILLNKRGTAEIAEFRNR